MYQIFTSTWLCKWSGFDSAVANLPAKLPWNPITKIRTYIYHASNILFRNGPCHKLLWFYRNMLLFHTFSSWHQVKSLVIWVKSTWRCRSRFWDSADSAGESVRFRDQDMAKMESYLFYWTKYDSTCKGSEQMTWIKHFSRVRLAPSTPGINLHRTTRCAGSL